MLAVVGLGNPGKEYTNTRHNVGTMVIEALENQEIGSNSCCLFKPDTYVNNSGEAVARLMREETITPEDIIVVHDDTEIPFGEIRVKFGGTSGGHNGIKSIDDAIGPDYWRVRVGVGRPENRNFDLADYVLAAFTAEELRQLPDIIDRVTEYLLESINEGIQPITLNAIKKT